jgi:predicted lysophospholipase L1 biosynthesis ABC-type transport system permease subunit
MRKLIVSTAAGLAAVVGAQAVAWVVVGKVPDELNDLP